MFLYILIVKWTLRNKLQWITKFPFMKCFSNVFCEMAAILSKERWVKQPDNNNMLSAPSWATRRLTTIVKLWSPSFMTLLELTLRVSRVLIFTRLNSSALIHFWRTTDYFWSHDSVFDMSKTVNSTTKINWCRGYGVIYSIPMPTTIWWWHFDVKNWSRLVGDYGNNFRVISDPEPRRFAIVSCVQSTLKGKSCDNIKFNISSKRPLIGVNDVPNLCSLWSS